MMRPVQVARLHQAHHGSFLCAVDENPALPSPVSALRISRRCHYLLYLSSNSAPSRRRRHVTSRASLPARHRPSESLPTLAQHGFSVLSLRSDGKRRPLAPMAPEAPPKSPISALPSSRQQSLHLPSRVRRSAQLNSSSSVRPQCSMYAGIGGLHTCQGLRFNGKGLS